MFLDCRNNKPHAARIIIENASNLDKWMKLKHNKNDDFVFFCCYMIVITIILFIFGEANLEKLKTAVKLSEEAQIFWLRPWCVCVCGQDLLESSFTDANQLHFFLHLFQNNLDIFLALSIMKRNWRREVIK